MAGAEMVISHFDRLWGWPALGTGLAEVFHAVGAGDEVQTSSSSFRLLWPGPGGSDSLPRHRKVPEKRHPLPNRALPREKADCRTAQCMARQVANQVTAVGSHRSMITVVASNDVSVTSHSQ